MGASVPPCPCSCLALCARHTLVSAVAPDSQLHVCVQAGAALMGSAAAGGSSPPPALAVQVGSKGFTRNAPHLQ